MGMRQGQGGRQETRAAGALGGRAGAGAAISQPACIDKTVHTKK